METIKRLIDANELAEELADDRDQDCNRYQYWYQKEERDAKYNFAIDRVNEAPTVDAVEVTEFDEILYKLECLLCHATGGKYSKAGYSLEDMERMVTDYIEECCYEAVEEKVVHGRWVLAKPRVKGRNATYRCTACGKLRSSYYNDVFQWEYCPCGAKMDGDELKKRILVDRGKIPLTCPGASYEFYISKPYQHGNSMRGGIRKALRCMEQCKTVDAVSVVRCKDCKFWEEAYGTDGKVGYCETESNQHGCSSIWYPDDYCSYGERKTDV